MWQRTRQLLIPCMAMMMACNNGPAAHNTPRPLTPAEAKEIARQAYIYAAPMIDNYSSMYQLAIDVHSSQYKGPMNSIKNVPEVFGPKDTAIVTANSDTPYSFLIMDLRREPLVVRLPPIAHNRYYSLQLVDLYTHNVDYLGTREDGNGGGDFLIAGPGWHGKVPAGIKRVVYMETALNFSQFRTQLFSAQDLDSMRQVQAGYRVMPLSQYTGTAAPAAVPAIDFPTPDKVTIDSNYFGLVNFLLQYCPADSAETALRSSFARIGIKPGVAFSTDSLAPDISAAIREGCAAGEKEIREKVAGLTSSKGVFGTRQQMAGKYLVRAAGARIGLYGNTMEEAFYPAYQTDDKGQPLNTGVHDYILRFRKDSLPPVHAFWSLTMYNGRRLMVDNPLNRYLINSVMLPALKQDADGGITLYIQHASPGKGLESNWLPAPAGPAFMVMRLYLPEAPALDGRWNAPALTVAR